MRQPRTKDCAQRKALNDGSYGYKDEMIEGVMESSNNRTVKKL